ncbi:UNVERIFIED_CONTAM: Beta-D-glucosyl crocetin beta-1,6-glucosyltransferase [Sesamum radiatum]|uniref:Beta-D-glucosyl crocetin beta-1,6-glucosyltransferase n=1 Tax=Sesamum radiatum TaxID=300843 RepID=A0AAW2QIN6_SESRA
MVSCMGIEGKYIDYLSTLCQTRIVVVGPLVQENAADHEIDSWIMNWLNRGLLVQEWAPQAAILASPAVAGFMSHCGLSSIMENVYFGVPVVAVPLKLDQLVNSRLVLGGGGEG